MISLETAIKKAFPVGLERARELLGLMTHKFYEKASIVELIAVAYMWGLRDMTTVVQEKKMGHRVELTDEQHKKVYALLPLIAQRCLQYLVSGAPKDSFFDAWAGGIISVWDTASWTDDAMGLAMTDVAEEYEKEVVRMTRFRLLRHNEFTPTELQALAEVRGALLRAGATLIAVNNDLVPAEKVDEAIWVAAAKYNMASEKLVKLDSP